MAHTFFDLTGKVAIVTGTSRGLGQFMGRALATADGSLAAPLPSFVRLLRPVDRDVLRVVRVWSRVETRCNQHSRISSLANRE